MGLHIHTATDTIIQVSCSYFVALRIKIAEQLGYEIGLNDDLHNPRKIIKLDYSNFEMKNAKGIWDTVPCDPLLYLIIHSDYDGTLSPYMYESLIERLLPLKDYWPKDDWFNKPYVDALIDGLIKAKENKK